MSEVYAPAGTVSATSVSRFTAAEAATGTFGTMDRATITELLDRTRYLDQTGQVKNALTAYIGDTSNASVTLGLTINQGAADDAILELKSSDVAHGVTTLTETDTYATARKNSPANGGLLLTGLADTGSEGLVLRGVAPTDDTTKTTAAVGAIHLLANKVNGTGVTTIGADGNLAVITNNGTARFIFDAEGSGHADVEFTTF
jgi:hypothetical protein